MSEDENKLLELFGSLPRGQQDKLIAFAEFLGGREANAAKGPVEIPRPQGESVTMAIRRLVRTYPMLDCRKLMGEASQFMAQHALNGRPASEVIDELEALFARQCRAMRNAE